MLNYPWVFVGCLLIFVLLLIWLLPKIWSAIQHRFKKMGAFFAVQNRSRFKTTRLINKRFCSTSQTNLFGRTTADPIKP